MSSRAPCLCLAAFFETVGRVLEDSHNLAHELRPGLPFCIGVQADVCIDEV